MSCRKHVLVVDDDEKVLLVLRHALAKLADTCRITATTKGQEALDWARANAVDLLVTDLKMPGMSGVELTQSLRDMYPSVPVIWVTAYRSSLTDDDAKRLMVYCLVDKPVRIDELRRIVRDALHVSQADPCSEPMVRRRFDEESVKEFPR